MKIFKSTANLSIVIVFLICSCNSNLSNHKKIINQVFLGYNFEMNETDYQKHTNELIAQKKLIKNGDTLIYRLNTEFWEYDCKIQYPTFNDYTKKLYQFEVDFQPTNQCQTLISGRDDIKELLTLKYAPSWSKYGTVFYGEINNLLIFLTCDIDNNKLNVEYVDVKGNKKQVETRGSIRTEEENRKEHQRQIKKQKVSETF